MVGVDEPSLRDLPHVVLALDDEDPHDRVLIGWTLCCGQGMSVSQKRTRYRERGRERGCAPAVEACSPRAAPRASRPPCAPPPGTIVEEPPLLDKEDREGQLSALLKEGTRRGRLTLDVCGSEGESVRRLLTRRVQKQRTVDAPLACTCSRAVAYSRHCLSSSTTEYGGGGGSMGTARGGAQSSASVCPGGEKQKPEAEREARVAGRAAASSRPRRGESGGARSSPCPPQTSAASSPKLGDDRLARRRVLAEARSRAPTRLTSRPPPREARALRRWIRKTSSECTPALPREDHDDKKTALDVHARRALALAPAAALTSSSARRSRSRLVPRQRALEQRRAARRAVLHQAS